MDIAGKKIGILGFGVTGKSTALALNKLGAEVFVQDDKLEDILASSDVDFSYIGKINGSEDLKNLDLIVKSPGLRPDYFYVAEAEKLGLKVISDLELAYLLWPNRTILAITGTNGKTTTTSLVGEIVRASGKVVHVIGNIGVGILQAFANGKDEDVYVIEVSSFQLENVEKFKPAISSIINVTPDHLDWHGGLENYQAAKLRIAKGLKEEKVVVNLDDEFLSQNLDRINGNKIFVSIDKKLENGYYFETDQLMEAVSGETNPILSKEDINLVGRHNLENVLVAVAMCRAFGIDSSTIKKAVKSFNAVEHRIEFVSKIQGVKYYNDSKGTNVDASIKAILAFDSPIILIAGGYDKKISYEDLIVASKGRVKRFILLGQTRDQLEKLVKEYGFEYDLVESMDEAVDLAYKHAVDKDIVLLSPASASWGMYPNFEVRGRHFKDLVMKLGD